MDILLGILILKTKLLRLSDRFQLENELKCFTRCLVCNNDLKFLEKAKIINRLPPKVKEWHKYFFICYSCDKIYWKGTHYKKMREILKRIENN
jgi:uncharacterized protein with PIN domain